MAAKKATKKTSHVKVSKEPQLTVQVGRKHDTDISVPIRVSKKTAEALKRMADDKGVLGLTDEDFRTALENYLKPKTDDSYQELKAGPDPKVSLKADEVSGLIQGLYTMNQVKPADPSILDTAKDIIYGDREQAYGSPRFNLDTIAKFWTVYLQRLFHSWGIDGAHLKAEDVSQMMILLKTARLIHNPTHKDSLVDQCGYAALQDRIQNL